MNRNFPPTLGRARTWARPSEAGTSASWLTLHAWRIAHTYITYSNRLIQSNQYLPKFDDPVALFDLVGDSNRVTRAARRYSLAHHLLLCTWSDANVTIV